MPNDNDDKPLVPVPIGPNGVVLNDLDAMFRFAQCYMQSGLAPTSFKNAQQLVICWAQAAELGLGPMQAIGGMSIINNRVGIMGDLALAMVESRGLLAEKEVEYSGAGNNLTCTITLQRKGRKPHKYSWSVQEAIEAGITGNPTWKKYPKRMTYYRALGFGLRDEFPDILKGLKTVEELADYPSAAAEEYEDTIDDEAKIRANREADDKAKAAGVEFVKSTGKMPTVEESTAPAFPEDNKPKPDQDDLEGGAPAKKPDPVPPVAPVGASMIEEEDDIPMGDPPSPKWKEYVISTIPSKNYKGRKLEDLDSKELARVESQWMPQIQSRWDEASDAQREEYNMFASAIAARKMEKPW